MTAGEPLSWNRLMQWRSECYARFGSVLNLPVVTVGEVLTGLVKPGEQVLDIGAGAHKPFEQSVTRANARYFSMDIDPGGTFDFTSFEDVPSGFLFNLIIASQVLEHLPADQAFHMVLSAASHMVRGGNMIVTVPNAAHPVRQRDCTHVTPWPMNDLYSLLRSAGLSITSMARYSKYPLTDHPLKRWVVETVCKEFRVDWCDSIVAVAMAGETQQRSSQEQE